MEQERIDPARLVAVEDVAGDAPLRVDLAYTRADAVCGAVYRPEARLWLYDDFAAIVVRAARLAGARYGLRLVVYDGLRTTDAQAPDGEVAAGESANPHWFRPESRVLTPARPRRPSARHGGRCQPGDDGGPAARHGHGVR